MKDRSMVDPATNRLIEKFTKLDSEAIKFINKLESTDYTIPETVKGVVSVRQLVSLH